MNGDDFEELDWQPASRPDERIMAAIEEQLTGSLEPVRELPGDGRLLWLVWGAFLALSTAAALAIGEEGFRHQTLGERIVYYAVIAGLGALFAAAAIQEMVPGSKRRVRSGWVIAGSLAGLSALVAVLFPSFRMANFVHRGLPCLLTGTGVAAVAGGFSYFLTRSGYVVRPVAMGVLLGCFAGLVGVAVLAVACPVQNAVHIWVWHFGTILVAGAAGWGLGQWRERVSS